MKDKEKNFTGRTRREDEVGQDKMKIGYYTVRAQREDEN